MVKKRPSKESGRWYSKKTVIEYNLTDPDDLTHWASGPKSIIDQVIEIREGREKFLQTKGLPFTPSVHYSHRKAGSSYKYEVLNERDLGGKKVAGETDLDTFIIKCLGYNKDSSEGIAARIIYNAHQTFNVKGETALEYAIRLGDVIAYGRVYALLDQSRKRPRASGKNPHLITLIKYLIANNPNVSSAKIFSALPTEYAPLDIDGSEYWVEDGKLYIQPPGSKIKEVRESTFKDYFRKNKKLKR